jgi:hypothetical protein
MEEDDYTRITLRIPKHLHQKLTESARISSKSMNAEIVARLDFSFEQVEHGVAMAALQDMMAETMRDLKKTYVSQLAAMRVALEDAIQGLDMSCKVLHEHNVAGPEVERIHYLAGFTRYAHNLATKFDIGDFPDFTDDDDEEDDK